MASMVVWVILHEQTCFDTALNLGRGDHPVGPGHLPDGMGQEQDSFRGALLNLFEDVLAPGHHFILTGRL